MNQQSIISVVVMFVLTMLAGFLVHGVLLNADYLKLGSFRRGETDAQNHFALMLIAHVFLAIGPTALYRGREAGKSWVKQGLCFGFLFAIATTVPNFLIYYAIQPWPQSLICKQILLDSGAMLLIGMAVAGLNRAPAAESEGRSRRSSVSRPVKTTGGRS